MSGDVQTALRFVDDAVTRRYEISSVCSNGTTFVFKAFERERRRIVALKLKRGAFVNSVTARSSYREVVYLKQLGGHPNIAEIRETYVCANGVDLCLTLRFMETDLKASIVAGRLLPIHRTYIATQLLTALEFLHAAHVAHRDVEPANVLLDPACSLQLTGFGTAKYQGNDRMTAQRRLTDDVGALWYRPYDTLLGADCAGGLQGDLWSLGCLMLEMETGSPLFPGDTQLETLARQYGVLGAPSRAEFDEMECGERQSETLANAVTIAASQRKAKNFHELIEEAYAQRQRLDGECASLQAVAREAGDYELFKADAARRLHLADFIALCVNISPRSRGTAAQCLRHPLFDKFEPQLKKGNILNAAEHPRDYGHLDDGYAQLPAATYRDSLADFVLRSK